MISSIQNSVFSDIKMNGSIVVWQMPANKGSVLAERYREIPKLGPKRQIRDRSKCPIFFGLNVKIGYVWFFFLIEIYTREFSGRYIHGEGPFCIRKLLGSSSKKCSLGSDLRTCGHITIVIIIIMSITNMYIKGNFLNGPPLFTTKLKKG